MNFKLTNKTTQEEILEYDMIELDNGQLTWIPLSVLYKGEYYVAPLNLLPILVRDVIIESLNVSKTIK